MRSGTDPDVVSIAPIDEVMTRFSAWNCMVRDFVAFQPMRSANLIGRVEHVRRSVVIGQALQCAAPLPLPERRAAFDGQLIERYMISGKIHGASQLIPPVIKALILPRIDEIKAHTFEHVSCSAQRPQGLVEGMQPPQPREISIVESLNPHRHAIDACRSKIRKARGFDRSRVCLQSDLYVRHRRPEARRRVDNICDKAGIHQARRAASKEDRVQPAGPDRFEAPVQLSYKRGTPPFYIDAAGNVGIEIAIRALGLTERPVDVEPETACLPVLSQNTRPGTCASHPRDG